MSCHGKLKKQLGEPVNVAMAIFGVGFIGIGIGRCLRSSRKAVVSSSQIKA